MDRVTLPRLRDLVGARPGARSYDLVQVSCHWTTITATSEVTTTTTSPTADLTSVSARTIAASATATTHITMPSHVAASEVAARSRVGPRKYNSRFDYNFLFNGELQLGREALSATTTATRRRWCQVRSWTLTSQFLCPRATCKVPRTDYARGYTIREQE